MVVVLGLALLSEVTIGLDAVLEAVELSWCVSMISPRRSRHPLLPPPFRIAGDGVVQTACYRRVNVPPSMSLRFGNRPGRLYAWSVSINKYHQDVPPKTGRSGRVRVVGGFIPLREMTSLMVVIWSGYELEVVDAFCAGAEGA